MPSPSDRSAQRRVLFGGWAVYCAFGLVMGAMAPLVTEISADLDVSKSAIGLALGAWPLAYLPLAIPAGTIVDRVGLRRSLTVGGIIIVISGLLRAAATGPVSLFGAIWLFGVGAPLISVGAPKLVRSVVPPDRRGAAMGFVLSAPAVGSASAFATTNSVVMPAVGDWRRAVIVYALVASLGVVGWVVASRHADRVGDDDLDMAAEPGAWRRLLGGGRAIQVLLGLAILVFFYNHALNNWLPTILEREGLGSATAGFVASASVVAGIAGALLIPRFAGDGPRRVLLSTAFAVTAALTAMIAIVDGPAAIVPAIGVGFVRAGLPPVLLALVMSAPRVDDGNMGAAAGLFFTAGEIGGFLGPVVVGVAADSTGSFTTALLVLAAVAVAMLLVATSVDTRSARPGRVSDDHPRGDVGDGSGTANARVYVTGDEVGE